MTQWCLSARVVLSLLLTGRVAASVMERGFVPVRVQTPQQLMAPEAAAPKESIPLFCRQLGQRFGRYGWETNPCGRVRWQARFRDPAGYPLLYGVFGTGRHITLFLGGVHPDELSPIQLAFRFARHLHEHPDFLQRNDLQVIVAPLVAPSGFMRDKPLRTNGHVDVNRNFLTLDWYERAIKLWQARKYKGERYFPGFFPHSETETWFQSWLLERFSPRKVMSVHAPLGFLDYDGPRHKAGFTTGPSPQESNPKQYVHAVSAEANNYPVVDYETFPGSLGNYAGLERHLATVTLELESTDPHQVERYWGRFLPGFLRSVDYPIVSSVDPPLGVSDLCRWYGIE